MDLFSQISGHLSEKSSVTINIVKLPGKKQEMSVSLICKLKTDLIDDDDCYLSPIVLKGDAEKLDSIFIETIKEPLSMLNLTSISLNKFKEELESLTKTAKNNAESEAGVTKVTVEENKKEQSESKTEKESTLSEKRTLKRVEVLLKKEFSYNTENDRYEKGESYISQREVKLLSDDAFERFLTISIPKTKVENEIEEEKIEKPEGADKVNAFVGNADKVGIQNIAKTKDKKLTKSSDTPKEKFFDDDGNIQENKDFDKEPKEKPEEKEKEQKKGKSSFF